MWHLKQENEEIIDSIILNKTKIRREMSVTYRSQRIKNALKTEDVKEEEYKKEKKLKLVQKTPDLCPLYKDIKNEFESIVKYKISEAERDKVIDNKLFNINFYY